MSGHVDPVDGPGQRPSLSGRERRGLHREVFLLVPVSLLLLALLAGFVLLIHRTTLGALIDERRDEARRLAAGAAQQLAAGVSITSIRHQLPVAAGIAVIAGDGTDSVRLGHFDEQPLLAPLGGVLPNGPIALGPDERLRDVIAGFAPLGASGTVRVDLPARTLARRQAGIAALSWVVGGASCATLLFIVVVLRQLMGPIEALLDRARQMGATDISHGDEMSAMISTFEQAMAALELRREAPSEDPLTSLGSELAPRLEAGLLLLDPHSNVLAINARALELLGLPENPPSGIALDTLLAAQPELAARLLSAAATPGVTVTFDGSHAANREQVLGINVYPLRVEGAVRGNLVLLGDVTTLHREQVEHALAASLAELAELSAGVAHELRNGLATLVGYLGMLSREVSAAGREPLHEATVEARNLTRVVADFLDFARPGRLARQPVELVAWITATLSDPALAEAELVVSLPPVGVWVQADPQLLERAWRNLLRNATEAACADGRRGRLEVSLEVGERGVELALSDDGPGVTAELAGRLFRPFATGRPGGVGLGLALAHRIVTLHGGSLRLENKRLDDRTSGARAIITLPDSSVSDGNRVTGPDQGLKPTQLKG